MNAVKFTSSFDPEKLLNEVLQFSNEDYYPLSNPYLQADSLFGIHLIAPKPRENAQEDHVLFAPNDRLKQSPYLLSVFNFFECEMETFRIHRLKAGASIQPHRDVGRNYENGVFRIHIPVQTSDSVKTILNGESIRMQPGECWYLNFDLMHEIRNESSSDRIHLILDCRLNDWWKDQFHVAGHIEEAHTPFKSFSESELHDMLKETSNLDSPAVQEIQRSVKAELMARNLA